MGASRKSGQQAQSPSYGGGGAGKGRGLGANSGGMSGSAVSQMSQPQQAISGGQMYAGGSPTFNEMGTGAQYQPPTQTTPQLSAPVEQPVQNSQVPVPQNSPKGGNRPMPPPQTPMAARAQAVQNQTTARSPVRADVYNQIHPYAKPLQGNAQGMAAPPPSYQRPAWMDMKVEPGNKEQFAARRAAQIAETNANRTYVPGQNGMGVSYGPGYVGKAGMGAYMNDTLHGRAPSGGTSVPGSGLNLKGR